MSTTNFSESQSYRVKRSFLYKWKMNDFCCHGLSHKELLPSTKFEFDFDTGLKLVGELSIGTFGMECTLALRSPTHQFWRVYGMLWVGEQRPTHRTIYCLNQICNTMQINLTNNLINYSWSSTVMCEVIYVDYKKIAAPRSLREESYGFTFDFMQLFESKKYSDVTLEVAGFEIPAHKCILASRSKVFAAMFEHDMKESKSNRVTIRDIDVEVFLEMLRYIYTDQVTNLDEMMVELLIASDMYDLQNLKSMCEIQLADELSTENASEILIFAHLYAARELKQHTIHFIKCNTPAVARTAGWQRILKKYIHLVREIFL